MKHLIFILLFPLSLLAQDTIRVVGSKANGTPSGEWKQFIITANSASIIQGTGTVALPSGGGSTDSSIFATVYQLGLKANLAEMNNALSGKAATSHGHAQSEITDLVTALSGKAATSHGHTISDVTNLQTSLDAKLATTAVNQGAYLSDTTKFPLTTSLRQGAYLNDTTKFALTSHTQAQSTITGLIDSLAEKADLDEMNTIFNGKAESYHVHEISDVLDLETNLGTKQATISNLADTSKYIEYGDTTSTIANQWRLGGYYARSDTGTVLLGKTRATEIYEPKIAIGTTGQYWRGDKTWQALPAGGYPYTEVVRTADTTRSEGATITWANIGQLEFNMDASGIYEIEGMLFLVRATAANGFTIAHNFTVAPTRTIIVGTGQATVAIGTDMRTENFIDTYLDSLAITATTVTTGEFVTFKGRIDNAASVNAYRLRWHCELATNVTLK